jgi:carbon monoxide dehydrogenase subunit G
MAQLEFRGSTIFFDATCLDKVGAPVTPTTATLYVSYTALSGVRTKATITMTITGNALSASWDSSAALGSSSTGADTGRVRWSIHAEAVGKITEDGEFTIWANEANTVPA